MTAPFGKSAAVDLVCRYWLWALGAIAVLCFIDVAAVAISYLVYPGYLDHGEPSVALISWRLLDGLPAFLGFDEPVLISNIYGPLTYVFHALSFWLLGMREISSRTRMARTVIAAILHFNLRALG